MQIDAPIDAGNPGGSLLGGHARMIGVISQGRGNAIAFAVPVDTLRREIADRGQRGRTGRQ